MSWYCTRCGHQAVAAGPCPRDGEALARVSSHDLHGRALGEYRILATLGGGAYGTVFRAVQERSGMLVAIKLLHRPIDDVESKRVIVEARAAATIDHPNVAKVYDLALTTDRRPYIVMQLLEGKPLSALIAKRIAVHTAVAIANDVLAALCAAHARGVIHRDLKPDNIIVTKGRALIVDFGLAKLVADPRSPSLTQTGEAIGTPHYMAPEQVRGELADGRTDLYAVGCVLFEMLAGRPPFEGSATYAIFDAHLHKPAPSISSLRSDIPPAVDAAIARALAKDAGSRFADAAEMQRGLARVIARPRRWPLGVAAVMLGGGIAFGAVLATRGSPEVATDDGSDGPPSGPRRFSVPPPLPSDPPLDPKWEDSLRSTADMFSMGQYKRAEVVAMRCGIQPMSPQVPAALHAYMRRLLVLLETVQPDLDFAKDCAVKPPPPKRFAVPAPLPDEGKIDPGIDQIIGSIHEQLDANRLTDKQARDMHCDFVRQREVANADGTGLHRAVRSMHRRIEILLEAYYPGSTKVRCQ